MRRDFSPEERLLRLIKGSKKKEAPKEQAEAQADATLPTQNKPQAKGGSVFASLSFRFSGINTRVLNSALIVILVCLLLYLVYDLFYTSYIKEEPEIFAEETKAPMAEKIEESLDIPPYSAFSSAIEGRNIFLPPQVDTVTIITGPTVEEISSNLSLIGVIAGTTPQAIIEEKKSGKSYFLYKGGSIGRSKVVEVLEDSVVMEYQGERFELVL